MANVVSLVVEYPSGTIGTLTPDHYTVRTTLDESVVSVSYGLAWQVYRQDNDQFVAGGERIRSWQETGSSFLATINTPGNTFPDHVPLKIRALFIDADNVIPLFTGGFTNFTCSVNSPPSMTLVAPGSGATVGTLTPTLTYNFTDAEAGNVAGDFAAYQLQVRRKSDSVSFWDTGQTATTSGEMAARQVAKVYAGTTLVNATVYQVRARGQDGGGLWSDYTAWTDFTPNAVPNPPTLTGPSGLTNTLTPTIQGSYNQGSGGTQSAFQYQVRQNTVTIYSSGDVATAIATGQAYGTDNAGDTPSTPPALAWGTAYSVRARSKDNAGAYSDWSAWLAFTTNAPPTTPTGLTPTNNAVTGDTTPTLAWVHNDPDGDAQTAVEVELYNVTSSAYVTGYNPKALTQSTLTHDVTETLSTGPTDYRWRVRTKGLAGPGFGPWSDWQPFTVATAPTITMTEPDPDEVIPGSAFLVTWTFSGGSGTQSSYRVRVYASDQTTVVYDSGVVSSTALQHQVPAGNLKNNRAYYFNLLVTDTLSQAGDSGLVAVTTSYTPPATITGLQATAIGGDS